MSYFITDIKQIIELLNHSEHNSLLEELGRFIEKEIAPTAKGLDEAAKFPKENIKKLFEQGFQAISLPEEYGGLGMPFTIFIAALEMLSKACASTSITLAINNTVCEGIRHSGTEEQKTKYLKPLAEGKMLSSFALTEPDSGSDAKAMKTKAVLEGDHYILNGTKMWITNAGEADVYFVFANTEKGPSAFLVDKDTDGLSIGNAIPKLGIKASKTAEVVFENCKVPKENLVGEEGKGFEQAKKMLGSGRITIGAFSVGIAQAAYEKTLNYANERKQFGKFLAEFQLTKAKLADMVTGINAARLLTYLASELKENNKPFIKEASQAKLFSSEMALRVCDEAIQIHGGYGYGDEYDVHRHWRDAKLATIGEGTSEVQRLVIASEILKAYK